MPLLNIATNVSKNIINFDLPVIFSEELSKLMGKPINYVACNVSPDNLMAFGGTTDPCALVTLTYMGQGDARKHALYSKRLSELLQQHLGVTPDRFFKLFLSNIFI